MVTVDTPVLGHRERDVRNGVVPPLRIGPRNVVQLGPQILQKPVWAWRMARDGLKMVGAGTGAGIARISWVWAVRVWAVWVWGDRRVLSCFTDLVVGHRVDEESLERAAARERRSHGTRTPSGRSPAAADGVIVSNHGGRQLEGAPATLRVLPEVVAAVGNQTTVLVDGGVRRGSDVVKAIALGARAVLVGRPYLYGLAASGEAGVERVFEILEEEMSRTMALLGCRDLATSTRAGSNPRPPSAPLLEERLSTRTAPRCSRDGRCVGWPLRRARSLRSPRPCSTDQGAESRRCRS